MKLTDAVEVNQAGHLMIGGVDTLKLAQKYGTPVIAYDVSKIKKQIADFKKAFIEAEVPYKISYASKAFSSLAMYELVAQAGLGCDVVSGGELYAALKGGMPPEDIEFHGNNKLPEEIEMGVEAQIGCFVIDNFQEIKFLDRALRRKHAKANVVLRVTPGIEAETHKYISTGQSNSKFGFDVQSGQAKKALESILKNPRMNIEGLHCHIGSQIFQAKGFVMAAEKMVDLMKKWHDELGFDTKVLNLGGGFGIHYTKDDQMIPTEDFAKDIIAAVKSRAKKYNLKMPEIWIEPGRSLAGEAGTTLYTVGSRKDVEGVCHFIAVDGGMGDNIRPALYQAKYEAYLAERPNALNEQIVTVVGKYCESGDVLVRDCLLPNTHPGDILAIPDTGAYGYTMASNYNRNPRPAVVFCENGSSRLVVRRETFEDMLSCELGLT
ncbi:diaminopimelate decarboxylase [Ligilactobacillus sp. WILCCON 0076]|uniref:Diaminopimelate decarboxylase n=1 Tax=Ligilactobacillus ubinensis TaxID=2876789 RepID=A0A9X2FRJ6_9LACO|nr:diaminopimelate decarboxylase [Ligilactobacillus ubinensis]MCP0888096.1 diaminopimelate decarboxylase [Ligilactobacillus ubinensis]